MNTHKKAYSVSEVTKTTGLGKTNIYQLIKDGSLHAKKVGRRTIVLEAELDRYLNALPDYKVEAEA